MIKFFHQPNTYTTDQAKISNALSLVAINNATHFWVTTVSGKIAECIRDRTLPPAFADYADFEAKFREYFGIKDERSEAQVKISKLYQGNWTVEEYSHHFNEVAQKMDFNDSALLAAYQVSINRDIHLQIQRDKLSRKTIDTLGSWQEAAIAIDNENQLNKEQNIHFDALARLQLRFPRNLTTAAVPAPVTPCYTPPTGAPPAPYFYPRPNANATAPPPPAAACVPPALLPPRPAPRNDPNAMDVDRS